MLVDDIGDVTITNDGATILKMLEVEHPAAKVRQLSIFGQGDCVLISLEDLVILGFHLLLNFCRSLSSWLNFKTEKLEMEQLLL